MDFRTELSVPPGDWSMNLGDQVLTLGSCFAQSIGERFLDNKFEAMVNPFGTTYHPISIHKLISYAAYQEFPAQHTYLENDDAAFNYDFHSSLTAPDRARLQDQIKERICMVHFFLTKCKTLILTYGTSWIYERNDTGEQVGNCHQQKASLFSKHLSSAEEIKISFLHTASILFSINPALKIILTVSPVRHVKDTLSLNSVSKAILRVACHQISYEHAQVEYFPAYEILMDDLRDYRFYKNDLIHPTDFAEEYIWKKFLDRFMTKSTTRLMEELKDVQKAIDHLPFRPESQTYQKFLKSTLSRLEELKTRIDVDAEILEIKSRVMASPYSKK